MRWILFLLVVIAVYGGLSAWEREEANIITLYRYRCSGDSPVSDYDFDSFAVYPQTQTVVHRRGDYRLTDCIVGDRNNWRCIDSRGVEIVVLDGSWLGPLLTDEDQYQRDGFVTLPYSASDYWLSYILGDEGKKEYCKKLFQKDSLKRLREKHERALEDSLKRLREEGAKENSPR